MRLIGEFQNEKDAFGFQIFLQNHGIKSLYEPVKDSTDSQTVYRLWVVEEDDFDHAFAYYQEWKQDPSSHRFQALQEESSLHKSAPGEAPSSSHASWRISVKAPPFRSPFSLNNMIIILCSFLLLWNSFQYITMREKKGTIALEYELTPLQKELLFDYPSYFIALEDFFQENDVKTSEDLKKLSPKLQERFKKIEDTPTWKGVADMIIRRDWTLPEKLPERAFFGKIREGQVWRLFTPVLLHAGLLHLLFNMAWLFLLGRQIEERIGIFRYLILTLLLGVVGNVAQYLVSGPIFLGYSGIVTGMVGFIWSRQKRAPWEGYPLQRPVIIFITVFVFAMLVLEVVSMALQFFHITDMYANIANTAHIIGGVFGVYLGRLSFFARSHR